MNHPKSVQIGGNNISVSLIDGVSTNVETQHYADYFSQKGEIRISTLCPDGKPRCLDFLNVCLWHEYVEGIKDVFQITNLEEEDVEKLAQGIVQILSQSGIKLIRED
jgi:hypothetical protein